MRKIYFILIVLFSVSVNSQNRNMELISVTDEASQEPYRDISSSFSSDSLIRITFCNLISLKHYFK